MTTGSLDVWAATDEALDEIQIIRVELDEIDRLIDAVNGTREWNRDGLNMRIDSRTLRTLARLHQLAKKLVADQELGDDVRRILGNLLDKGLALSVQREKLLDMIGIPLGRYGTPEDIAAAVVYMAAPASGWVTGQCLYVTGGR